MIHLKITCVAGVLISCFAAEAAEPEPAAASEQSRPNVLFLIADDQRPDTIHALGNSAIRTPNLDALVRSGTVFTRATCSHPLCVPSRAELLTGCTGFRNGVHPPRNEPDLSLKTWPAAMREAGYHTWWVGKWHLAGRPSTRGFDESLGLFASGRAPKEPQFDYRGQEVTGYRGWMFQSDDRRLFPEPGVGLTPDISVRFADAAIEFIERQPDARPWFLQVNFTAPHDPLLLPPGNQFAYDAAGVPVPQNLLPRHPFDHGNFEGRDEQLLPWPRTESDVRRNLAVYYAVVSHLDAQIGRLVAALRQTRQLENTLIIYTSDHGLALGSHGLMGKQNQYEHTINVPLIFSGPGIIPETQRSAQCCLRDLVPTVCELCSVPVPPTVEATSLVPILRGEKTEVHPFIVGYFSDTQRMIRTDRWKYIRYPQVQREQLFDLINDPLERHDLSQRPELADRRAQLNTELSHWLRAHGDPLEN